LTWRSRSKSRPPSSNTVPEESEQATTVPPSWLTFWIVYSATLPDPETSTRLPSKDDPRVLSISSAKKAAP
jgi:hypothetical protein